MTRTILLFALVLGFLLRFLLLANIPPGFNWDEASVAYNAYSLAQTGRDEFGRTWPIIIESFGDYKTSLYSILLVPFIKIFGLSVFVARFPNVLVGVLTIFASYYFARQYFGKRLPAALVAVLIAISPWAIHVSRFVLEWHLGIPLTIFGGACLLQTRKTPKYLLFAAIFFASALYFYHSLRLFIPLLLPTFLALNWQWFIGHKKEVLVSFLLGFVVLLPFLFSAVANNIFARPTAVSIFNAGNEAAAREGQYRQTVSHLPLFALFNNPPVVYAQEFLSRYLVHYSPQFLFTGQLQASPRTAVQKVGLLYLASLPFLVIGVYVTMRKKTWQARFVLAWFLLAPIASSLSQDSPHELRSLVFLPMFEILTVSGMLYLEERLRTQSKLLRNGLAILTIAAYVAGVLFFLNRYYLFYPEETAQFWQTGHGEMVKKVQQYEPFFDHIIVTTGYGQPHIFFAFFAPIDPVVYQATIGTQAMQFNGRLQSFGKIQFRVPIEADLCEKNMLVVTTQGGLDKKIPPFDVVKSVDRYHEPSVLFELYSSTDPLVATTLCATNTVPQQ